LVRRPVLDSEKHARRDHGEEAQDPVHEVPARVQVAPRRGRGQKAQEFLTMCDSSVPWTKRPAPARVGSPKGRRRARGGGEPHGLSAAFQPDLRKTARVGGGGATRPPSTGSNPP